MVPSAAAEPRHRLATAAAGPSDGGRHERPTTTRWRRGGTRTTVLVDRRPQPVTMRPPGAVTRRRSRSVITGTVAIISARRLAAAVNEPCANGSTCSKWSSISFTRVPVGWAESRARSYARRSRLASIPTTRRHLRRALRHEQARSGRQYGPSPFPRSAPSTIRREAIGATPGRTASGLPLRMDRRQSARRRCL